MASHAPSGGTREVNKDSGSLLKNLPIIKIAKRSSSYMADLIELSEDGMEAFPLPTSSGSVDKPNKASVPSSELIPLLTKANATYATSVNENGVNKFEPQNESERDSNGPLCGRWSTFYTASSNKNGVDKVETENKPELVSQGTTTYTTSLDVNDTRKVEAKKEPEHVSQGTLVQWSTLYTANSKKNGVDKVEPENEPESACQGQPYRQENITNTTSLDGIGFSTVETKDEAENNPQGTLVQWSTLYAASAKKNSVDRVEPDNEPQPVFRGQENITHTTSLNENGARTVETQTEPKQNTQDALYRQFGIVDPDSRVGRRVAAFYKQATYDVMADLAGAENYVLWSSNVLTYIPDRCRQIIVNGETQASDEDPEAVVMWEALNGWLYRYIWRSLGREARLATIHPHPRSAYRLWSDLYARYGHSAAESGRRDLIQKLIQLKPTRADRKHDQVRDIVARLAKLGYDLDDGVLGGLFDRSVPETERIEEALAKSSKLVIKADHWVVRRMTERVFSRLPSG